LAPELFSFWDILFGTGWAIIIVCIGLYIRIVNRDKPHFKLLMPVLSFKLFFAFLFGLTYSKILEGGGDTLAYWEGAVNLNQLFWYDPMLYFEELLRTPDYKTIGNTFNTQTGFPPPWIYKEPESFFICKALSLFTFFTFNSYIALTLIFSAIATYASWKFFETIRRLNISTNFWVVTATLFIPTLAFWCSGISKDTMILSAIFLVISHVFAFIDKQRKGRVIDLIMIVIASFVLYKVRPFMLIAIVPPLFLAYGTNVLKRFSNSVVFLITARVIVALTMLTITYLYFSNSSELGNLNPDKYLEEVVIIQQDFAQNQTYTGYRYDLNINDYTPAGMLKAAPMAIITGIYRPFLWEANSLFLFLSGLEGLLLIYLTVVFLFFKGGLFNNIKHIRKQEILLFSALFVFVFSFFVGFSSGLFNVLVRFKAPMLPFIILILSSVYAKEQSNHKTKSES
jgi:hypothetical protein